MPAGKPKSESTSDDIKSICDAEKAAWNSAKQSTEPRDAKLRTH